MKTRFAVPPFPTRNVYEQMPLPDLFQPALSRRLIYKEGIRFPRRGKIVSLRIVLAIYAIITEVVGLFFPPSIGFRVLEFFEIYVIGLYIGLYIY